MTAPRRFAAGLALAMLASLPALPAAAADERPARLRVNLPPSADLAYAVNSRQRGFALDGKARIAWRAAAGKFSLETEVRSPLLGKILEAKSEGSTGDAGLAPAAFSEKRFRRDKVTATFDRAAKTVSYSQGGAATPLKGGEQDRSSAIWQLIAVARAAPARLRDGSEWPVTVIGPRDAEPWVFTVVAHDRIRTPLGELETVHLTKTERDGEQHRQQVDIWLAPSLEWYPARIRYTEQDGDFIEQTLTGVAKKPNG